MKKFILSLFFVIFALFNVCGEDLLHPVIRDDIDEDIKKIEQALVDYVLYPELVERGFDVHQLDKLMVRCLNILSHSLDQMMRKVGML